MDKLALHGGKPIKTKPFPTWPMYTNRELELVEEVIRSQKWWRMTGSKVKEFEEQFAKMQGVGWALAVTNGTHAIELALAVLEIGEGDEVIVPAFTFMSTATAPIYCNATPVPVDVDPMTFCMDPDAFKKAITPRTKAVIPVHMAGHACDMDAICTIAKEYGIQVIEDASHAQGAEWQGVRLGNFGDLATFSFQNGKLMTCGEGGALVGNSPEVREKAFLIHSVGRPAGDRVYAHLELGSNYRMTELQAAVLLAQLERIEEHNQLRIRHAAMLDQHLQGIAGITPQSEDARVTRNSHYMYMFYYDPAQFGGMSRATFVDALIAEGVPAFVAYPVIHKTEFFQKGKFRSHQKNAMDWNQFVVPHAEKIADCVVWLPHQTLLGTDQDVEEIAMAIRKIQNSVQ